MPRLFVFYLDGVLVDVQFKGRGLTEEVPIKPGLTLVEALAKHEDDIRVEVWTDSPRGISRDPRGLADG